MLEFLNNWFHLLLNRETILWCYPTPPNPSNVEAALVFTYHIDLLYYLWFVFMIVIYFFYSSLLDFYVYIDMSKKKLIIKRKLVYRFDSCALLEGFWTVIPGVFLIDSATPGMTLLYGQDVFIDPAVLLKITGNQWFWNYDYGISCFNINFDSNLDTDNFSKSVNKNIANNTFFGDIKLPPINNYSCYLPNDFTYQTEKHFISDTSFYLDPFNHMFTEDKNKYSLHSLIGTGLCRKSGLYSSFKKNLVDNESSIKKLFSKMDFIEKNTLNLSLTRVDNPVYLPLNTKIRLLLTSNDVIHSWALPAAAIKVDSIPGRVNQFDLVIKKRGVFRGQCSEFCGVGHAFMPIVVVSVSAQDFDYFLLTWLSYLKPETSFNLINYQNFILKKKLF